MVELINQNQHISEQSEIESIYEMLAFYPGAIGLCNKQGDMEYVNQAFTEMFGYTLEDIPTVEQWMLSAYPDEEYREQVIASMAAQVELMDQNQIPEPHAYFITCKNGTQKKVIRNGRQFRDKLVVDFNDVTNEWQANRRLNAQTNMLEMVAKGDELGEILDAITQCVEVEDPTAVCSILLMDESGKHLLHGSAPNLPDFYNQAIDGMEIGLGAGSCGTAAFTKKRVIVDDVMSHEYWRPFLSLIEPTGLKSCWSEPIVSSKDKVLGTFAIYHPMPKTPSEDDISLIKFAANIASITIENRNSFQQLEYQAFHDYLTGVANRRYFMQRASEEFTRAKRFSNSLSLLMLDIDHFKKVNDKYGHSSGDLVLKKLVELSTELLRDIDLIGRIGGEEFAIILPHTDSQNALEVAERIRTQVETLPVMVDEGIALSYTVSIGVSSLKSNFESIDELFQQADEGLYNAKHTGRNRVCLQGEK